MIVVSFISIAYVCQVKIFQSFSYRFSILHEITLWEVFRPLPPPYPFLTPPLPLPPPIMVRLLKFSPDVVLLLRIIGLSKYGKNKALSPFREKYNYFLLGSGYFWQETWRGHTFKDRIQNLTYPTAISQFLGNLMQSKFGCSIFQFCSYKYQRSFQ